ncbi:hypothetical protein K458DRAFT_324544, partial [Lentithecium fluviatile CBS 122367]
MPPHTGARIHRDELPPLPTKWKSLCTHPYEALFRQAAQKEVDTLLKKGTWKEIDRQD